ncbi:MAG: hypothetical protein IJD21_06535 [Oscillospiraceae bacterium]|nr:hypothetical protein [Oscillospiraceae bacterium]
MNENQTKKTQDDLSHLPLRRREDAIKQQEQKKKARIYAVVALVTVVIVAALLIWDSGIVQRSAGAYEVNGQSYSATDVSYHYYNEYSSIASYASYYGLDTSLPLDEQEYAEDMTWHDYFLSSALSTLDEMAALTSEAKAEGYTISAEGQANIDSMLESVASAAVTYGVDEATYLTYCYGRYMNSSAFKNAVTDQCFAQDYAQHKVNNFEITESDMAAYYAENKASLDNFDYEAYLVSIDLPTEYDEEGNPIDFVPAQLEAAQAQLEINAGKLEEAMKAGDSETVSSLVTELSASDLSSLSSGSLSYYDFGQWLAEEGRQAGDVTKVALNRTDSTDTEYLYGYYVVKFNSRELDEYHGIDFYNLLIQADIITSEDGESTSYDWDAAKAEIEALQDEWLAGAADAESFLAMAEEHSDGSTTSYTNTYKGLQNAEVDEWLFSAEHEAGDYAIIQDNTLHGYRLVYVKGYSDLYYWQTIAKSAIQNDRYTEWLASAQEGHEGVSTSFMSYVGQ